MISRNRGTHLYAFKRDEVLDHANLRRLLARGVDVNATPLEIALDLHEWQESTRTRGEAAPPEDVWRNAVVNGTPSSKRLVAVNAAGKPVAVGWDEAREHREPSIAMPQPAATQEHAGNMADLLRPQIAMPTRVEEERAELSTGHEYHEYQSPRDTIGRRLFRYFRSIPDLVFGSAPTMGLPSPPQIPASRNYEPTTVSGPAAQPEDQAAQAPPSPDDEGSTPKRFPSIEAENKPRAGAPITLIIDLLREQTSPTMGGPVSVGTLQADWATLDLDVILASPDIKWDSDGHGKITMQRNAASIPATITGRVAADLTTGSDVFVSAQFMHGTRLAGLAMRVFRLQHDVGQTTMSMASAPLPSSTAPIASTVGAVMVDRDAKQPDVTVYIASSDAVRPQDLRWQITTARFDGLPPALHGATTLGSNPGDEASALFKEFAALEPGNHRAPIDGFGDRLWDRAPREWRDVYWALWDHYQRPLTIQFISDEPYLPWELMRPTRNDESETHPPLALKHAVGRWIRQWDDYMRNRLPTGSICTISPHYNVSSLKLARAEAESAMLQKDYAAVSVKGTYAAVKALFESTPTTPVALLHFSGHGSFASSSVGTSSIKLEDGAFTVAEAARREVKLGQTCRTLVIFNACEVGATSSSLGAVGGWADALLSREFGGFIAPLWSVEDEDASTVVAELLRGILTRREPISEVLRNIREKYGDTSPTFLSYLYYGDVTARLQSNDLSAPVAIV